MHVVFIQYGGDYRKAFNRLSSGLDETYGYQEYSIKILGQLVQDGHEVSVICGLTSEKYCEVLGNGVQAIGAGFSGEVDGRVIANMVAALGAERLIVRAPMTAVLKWAIKKDVPTLALLADSFKTQKITDKIKNYKLAKLLNASVVEWVANHNINACLSLKAISVHPQKIVPWDWPAIRRPGDEEAKQYEGRSLRLFYAGKLSELKGVSELLQAVQIFKKAEANVSIQLNVAGSGDIETFKDQACRLGIEDNVTFMGTIAHSQVCQEMKLADVVIVPSRREYPEGFPKTINEALCARTPLIISDHPVFNGIFENGQNALIFPSGSANGLANCLSRIRDPKLYHKLSLSTLDTWNRLQIPMSWGDVIQLWMTPPPKRDRSLEDYTLLSSVYSNHPLLCGNALRR